MAKTTDPLIGGPTTLYVAHGVDDEVIYVGITLSIPNRMSSHKRGKWWYEAERIELRHFHTRLEARLVEVRMIQECQPRYNIADKDEVSPGTPNDLPIELLSRLAHIDVGRPDLGCCAGSPGRPCHKRVPASHTRCSSCRTRLQRHLAKLPAK